MKLAELAKELQISTESFINFIQDFDLEISECISTNFEVKKDFIKFAKENITFLKKYEEDLGQNKSVEDIAKTIKQPQDKVSEILKKDKVKIYDNGFYKSSVSSYVIDQKLGGNYQFVYDYFGKKTSLAERDFIGYRDLFFFISKTLDPFLHHSLLTDWGIHKSAGIILYGPPGSGKIFWANKIAEIVDFQFKQIKKYYFGTSFVDGRKANFNDYLVEMMSEDKVLLFMDDFDTIMSERSQEKSVSSCYEETKEIVLHYVNQFEKEGILMIGSANSLVDIDTEILAPGRFDVTIPIFPPNAQERSEMILYYIKENLSKDAILMEILKANDADHLPFWKDISMKMKVFSNTMIIDFTQSLKKKIRDIYLKNSSQNIKITEKLLEAAFREASAKLTGEYLNHVFQFVQDVSINNYDDFSSRIEALKAELDSYKMVEKPIKTIGFTHNGDQDE